MVVSVDEIKHSKNPEISRSIQMVERSIDGELKQNKQRLNDGKEVMIPCLMKEEHYESLLDKYRANGWEVRFERGFAFGRLYFKAR